MSLEDIITKTMWIEKYRPTSLDDIVLCEDTKKLIEKFIQEDEFPHLFLCSEPGQGKTSLAKILAKSVFDCDTLYINASDENNVETVRTKITDFAMTASLNGKFKCIILDEADGFANIQSQKILRSLMETTSDTCRFILTANHRHKIFKPIISRTLELDITPPKKGIVKRLIDILINEKITLTREELSKIPTFVDNFYPDMRTMIKRLQSSIDKEGKLFIKDYHVDEIFMTTLLEKIQNGNALDVRKYYLDNEDYFGCNYSNLISSFYKFMIDKDICPSKSDNIKLKMKWTILLADYMYKSNFMVDAELNCAACFSALCSTSL